MFPFLGGLFGGGAGAGLGGLLGTINGIAGTVGGVAGLASMLQMNAARAKTQKLLQRQLEEKRTADRTGVGVAPGAPTRSPLPGLDELLAQSQPASSPVGQ